MDREGFSRALHVVDGDSAAGCLRAAFRLSRDQILVNEDRLSCGPAPATADLNDWREIREQFAREMNSEWPNFSFDEYAGHGLLMNAARLKHKDGVVIWAGLGLQEQLLLAWTVFLFDRLNVDLSKLHVVQFEALRPKQRILGMGELSPENIREYCPMPRQMNSQDLEELRRIWKIYTSSNPADFVSYVGGSTSMPIAHRAVSELLYRYPSVRSGLSDCDERLLHYTSENGPSATRVVGYSMGYNESLDWHGDVFLFHRLIRMAKMPSPLVSLTGSTQAMRDCEVKLSELGEKVLAGHANNFLENGLDDWIGGVHLSRKTQFVFRDGNSLMLD